jgi:23S rRNA (adenine2503-C2)-methyltransferase
MPTPRTRTPAAPHGLIDIRALDREGVIQLVVNAGGTPIQGLAVFKNLWQRGAKSFAEMTGVARTLLTHMEAIASIPTLESARVLRSVDGSVKYIWRLHDGCEVESVLIPDGHRVTLCMSSQVGCAMGCTFCLTGDMGLIRHMSASEIASQPLQVAADLPEGMRITNLVLMGMGEPLHNLRALVPALRVCLDDHALNFSHRRVTVSTVGLVPKMAELAAALPVNLAISINATTEEQRLPIMPITRKHSLAELLEAARNFPLPPGKRITFEYVMFRGMNDTLVDAERLFGLLDGIKAKVNLIPYNANPDRELYPPSEATVKAFQHYFMERGMSCSIRTTRGLDISAACGQLGKAG